MSRSKSSKLPDYAEQIRESIGRWNYLKENGGSDPFWSDGVNMNLVRNHILYYKRMISETMEEPEYPKEFYLETPPEVHNHYMSKPEEIREKAKIALNVLKHNEDYIFIKSNINMEDAKTANVFRTIHWINGFQESFNAGDLVDTRRCINAVESYTEKLKSDRKQLENILNEHPDNSREQNIIFGEQMSLFDMLQEE